MKVYDYMATNECDVDVWDEVFDDCVTICLPDLDCQEEWGAYEKYIVELIKKVEVTSTSAGEYGIVADWTGFFMRNLEILKEYADKNWYRNKYDGDDDEFAYQWLRETHLWCAGYVDEDTYAEFLNEYLCKMS